MSALPRRDPRAATSVASALLRSPHRARVAIASLLLLSIATSAQAADAPGRWSPRFDPPSAITAPLAILNGEVIAGEYRLAGDQWVLLGEGIDPRPEVIDNAIVDGSTLYVSGEYRGPESYGRTSFVARWDGDAWTLLTDQIQDAPRRSRSIALAVLDGQLHVGGRFHEIAGTTAANVARWDGTQWHALGAGLPDEVRTLAVFDGMLYAGGGADDDDSGEVDSGMLARWDGGTWTQVGAALNGPVESLLAKGSSLYVGGCFNTVGSTSAINARRIAKWNGSKWSALGTGVGSHGPCGSGGRDGSTRDTVTTIVSYENDIVVGGSFDQIGDAETGSIARWDGQQWSSFGDGFHRQLDSLVADGNDLYATGTFADVVNGAAIPGVARWNGASWRPVVDAGPASVGLLYAMESHGTDLYAAGVFDTAGGAKIQSLAKWNGVAWSALGDTLDGYVLDIAVIGERVFAAGLLRTSPEDSYDYHVARWDGTAWEMIDHGLGLVVALEAFQGKLYAAGTNYRDSSDFVAKWNGVNWKQVGGELKGDVWALEAGDRLYAGGYFRRIGDIEAPGVAAWNGTDWTELGNHDFGSVNSLAWSGTQLFAVGYFGGEFSFPDILARWDGQRWIQVGDDVDEQVYLVGAAGDHAYVSTSGLVIDGQRSEGLLRWNGSTWQALGRINASVLAIVGSNVYAGGWLVDRGGNNPEAIGLYALGNCGNGVLDGGEDCDPAIDGVGACCNVNSCLIADSGSTCRPSRGPCDRAETCDGETTICPADEIEASGFVCRQPIDGCHSTGICDGEGLTCSIDPIPPCSDGNFCNGTEICLPGGACQSSALVNCDDGDICTTDFCAEGNEQCGHGLAPGPGCSLCGDVNYDGWISSGDALLALRGAVGLSACPGFACDFDGSGSVTAADALKILSAAVGLEDYAWCPGNEGELPGGDDGEQPDG